MLKATRYFALVLGAMAAGLAAPSHAQFDPQWGGVDDVPTWRVGDEWDFNRSFTITIDGRLVVSSITLYLNLQLDFTDAYTLETTGTQQVQNTAMAGPAEAYVRARTAGSGAIAVSGELSLSPPLPDGTFNPGEFLRLVNNSGVPVADTSAGENWIGAGDFSQIRERFLGTGSGNLTLTDPSMIPDGLCFLLPQLVAGLNCDTPVPLTLGVDLAVDHAAAAVLAPEGGLELLDFPTIDGFADNGSGERWTVTGASANVGRKLYGGISLLVPGLLDPATVIDLDLSTGLTYRLSLDQKGMAPDPFSLFTNNRRVTGDITPNDDIVFYTPTAKEMSYWELGDLTVPVLEPPASPGDDEIDLIVVLKDFTTRLASASSFTLAPDPDFSLITLNPAQPDAGGAFVLAGSSATGASVTAEYILPSGPLVAAGSGPITGGAFSLNLTAPTQYDTSLSTSNPFPSTERETGSFGIRLTRDDGAVKVVTVRTNPPSSVDAWEGYQ